MKISALEEFGLRCLLRVAKAENPLAASAISAQEGISIPYVQKLLRRLVSANLVIAQRGSKGGFQLAKPADTISVGEVIRALGSDTDVDSICEKNVGNFEHCCHSTQCTIKPIWTHVFRLVIHTLDNLPLSVLLESPENVTRELDAIVRPPVQTFCPVGAIAPTSRSNL